MKHLAKFGMIAGILLAAMAYAAPAPQEQPKAVQIKKSAKLAPKMVKHIGTVKATVKRKSFKRSPMKKSAKEVMKANAE